MLFPYRLCVYLTGFNISAIARWVYYAIAIIRFWLMKQCDRL
jgi:hypothetical protein